MAGLLVAASDAGGKSRLWLAGLDGSSHIAPPSPLIGRTLSHYKVEEQIGMGGMRSLCA